MALTLEVEERASSEALALYLGRLLAACEGRGVGELIEVLRGVHTHHSTVAGDDGRPCAVLVTYVFTDDPTAVLAAIASANRPEEIAQPIDIGPEVPGEKAGSL